MMKQLNNIIVINITVFLSLLICNSVFSQDRISFVENRLSLNLKETLNNKCLEYEDIQQCTYNRLLPRKNSDFQFRQCNNVRLSFIYPNDKYNVVLYRWSFGYYDIVDSNLSHQSFFSHYIPINNRLYLIAYNLSDTSDVKFITGDLIISKIWGDFNSGGFEIKNILKFLYFKLYAHNFEELEFVRRCNDTFIFKTISKKTKKKCKIYFNSKKPDDIVIKGNFDYKFANCLY